MSSRRPAGAPSAAASLREVVAHWHALTRDFSLARSVADQRAVAVRLSAEPAPAAEAHALQAELLRRAWSLRPPAPLPPWRHLPLPGASRLAWARLTALVDSPGCRELVDSEPALWRSALAGLDPLDAPDPASAIETLAGLGDAASDRCVADSLPRAVARGLLAPDQAARLLLGRGDAWGWSQLGAPWAAALSLPRATLVRALRGPFLLAALPALAARLPWSDLRPLLVEPDPVAPPPDADPTVARRQRRLALAARAGQLAGADAIDDLLAVGLDDPAGLGDAVLGALVALHHRGHFVQPSHAAHALALLDAGARRPPDELAGVLFVARHAVVELLPDDADDPLWSALAPLLASWQRAPRPPSGLVDRLASVARRTRRPAVLAGTLALLRDLAIDLPAPDPAPLEAVALARLDDDPAGALALLAATAGEATRGELTRRLTAGGHVDDALAVRLDEALLVLWRATPDADRGALLDSLDPGRLPAALVASLASVSYGNHAQDALRLRAGVDDPDAALLALCALATPDDLPRLALGVRRSVEKAVAAATPRHDGARSRGCDCHACVPDAVLARYGEDAQQLPEIVASALDSLETRWRTARRGPAWLLAPGPRLRAELLLAAVDTSPAPVVLAALLRSLLLLAHPRLPALAAALLDHADTDVVKLAARLLARSGAAWLSLELGRGARHPDDKRARACLIALSEAGGPAAEAAALAMLDRPTMNLKKEGAAALAKVASPASAPTLLAWLGQHDNPGLREALTSALRRSLGDGLVPAVLASLDSSAGQDRRQRLLVGVLDGEVTPALARAVVRRAPGWERALLAAVASGALALRGAPASELAAELTDAGLAPPAAAERPAPVAPFDEAVAQLRATWTPVQAAAALASWPDRLDPSQVEKLRIRLDHWLGVLTDWRDVRPAALVEAALRASPDEVEKNWLRSAAPSLGALLAALDPAARRSLWPALERLADVLDAPDRLDLGVSLRACLGATPGLDRSPLTALTRCGLVLRREDVERALSGVADVPDPLALRRSILAEAFGVEGAPAGRDGPADERAHLRELIHEAPRGPTDALLWLLDRMEALHPIGVTLWSWPDPPAPAVRRPRPAPAARGPLADLHAWLDGAPDAVAPTEERLARELPTAVQALAHDERSLRRLVELIAWASPASALRRAYRPWLQALTGLPEPPVPLSLLGAALAHPVAASPWQPAAARAHQRTRWQALWTTPALDLPATPRDVAPDQRPDLSAEALAAGPEAARRALTLLAASPDAHWPALVARAVHHAAPRVRAHALRLARRTLDRADYVRLARPFLADVDPTMRRSAIRIVAHGGDHDSLPTLVSLLLDPVSWVRSEALAALRLFGDDGAAAVRHAIARARPDRARDLARALWT